MPINADFATLTVQLSSEYHNVGEVNLVIEALNSLAFSGVWAMLLNPDDHEDGFTARSILIESINQSNKANARFFPAFYRFNRRESPDDFFEDLLARFDPLDPMDAALITGLNSWIYREISRANGGLLERLLNFARITRCEHKSPLALELAIIMAMPSMPVLITYGILRAVDALRRRKAETEIRETERELKKEELKQRRLQTTVLEEIVAAMNEQKAQGHKIQVSEELLKPIVEISSPAVSDLSDSPFIGSVTLGISSKT